MRNQRNKKSSDYGDASNVSESARDVVDIFKKNKSMTFEDLNKINANT